VRSYDDFPPFFGIERTTPSWWSSLAFTASAIPVLSALDFSGAPNAGMPCRGDSYGARHARLQIGCIFCPGLRRFAESRSRNIEYFWLRGLFVISRSWVQVPPPAPALTPTFAPRGSTFWFQHVGLGLVAGVAGNPPGIRRSVTFAAVSPSWRLAQNPPISL
jgi:hypothetical protein